MKVILLAGGFGTRIAEESEYKPKPIIWHIMKGHIHGAIFSFMHCLYYDISKRSYFCGDDIMQRIAVSAYDTLLLGI